MDNAVREQAYKDGYCTSPTKACSAHNQLVDEGRDEWMKKHGGNAEPFTVVEKTGAELVVGGGAIRVVRAGVEAALGLRTLGAEAAEGEAIFGNCFIAGTPVYTKLGIKNIEDIRTGDYVQALNLDTGKVELKPVVRIFHNLNKATLQVKIEDVDGKMDIIGSSLEHPFWVDGKSWVAAKNLNQGDVLRTLGNMKLFVKSVAPQAELVDTFNFEVDGLHNYFVGHLGVLVHNASKVGDALSKESMLGENGVQTASKTVWKGEGKARIDVENSNPGQRPGQVHYQDNAGNKYIYDPKSNSFPNAPNSVNRLLNDSGFANGIRKAMKQYLGGEECENLINR